MNEEVRMGLYESLWIGGSWVRPSSDEMITVVDPSTEQAIGRVPEGTEADVDAAVATARRALLDPRGGRGGNRAGVPRSWRRSRSAWPDAGTDSPSW